MSDANPSAEPPPPPRSRRRTSPALNRDDIDAILRRLLHESSLRVDIYELPGERYYKYLRDEIQREDDIAHQRMSASLTLHGFLIASMTLLVNEQIKITSAANVFIHRIELALIAIGAIGFSVALATMIGVLASRSSIKSAVFEWEKKVRDEGIDIKAFPQAYGLGQRFRWGSYYYTIIPCVLLIAWIIYLAYFAVVYALPLLCSPGEGLQP